MGFETILNSQLEEKRVNALSYYNNIKDNPLFRLLYDSIIYNIGLVHEISKAGIYFGDYDKFLPDFLDGFNTLYGNHILDDGGIRKNTEELEKCSKTYEMLLNTGDYKKLTKLERPNYFTTKDYNNKDTLNGNGESEEQFYQLCIDCCIDKCLSFITIDANSYSDRWDGSDGICKEYAPFIEKYLTTKARNRKKNLDNLIK